MHKLTDKERLYRCYCKLKDNNMIRRRTVDQMLDKEFVSGLAVNAPLILKDLSSKNSSKFDQEIYKKIIKAKGMFFQFLAIMGRNPECITEMITDVMDKVIHEVCTHEARMIKNIKNRDLLGKRVNVSEIFKDAKNLRRLGVTAASDIVDETITIMKNKAEREPEALFITKTGKKYHAIDCPYCKGRELIPSTTQMINIIKLNPCKCVENLKIRRNSITAFIDESVHRVEWDKTGKRGVSGSYSYIICRGDIKDESQILNDMILVQGVDYTTEQKHVERITETAIGKVLMKLHYDYNFDGKVRIYTDNLNTSHNWKKVFQINKLATQFHSVDVKYIPREANKLADRLLHTRMILDIPIESYYEIVEKCTHRSVIQNA